MKLGAILVAVPLVGALRAPLGGVRTSRGAALRATVEKPAVSESPVRTTAADDVYVLTEEDPRPGLEENEVFRCDDSVAFWRDFQRDGPEDAASNFRRAAEVASAGLASGGAKAVVYWASHAARTAYFAGNAVLGTAAHAANQRASDASSSEAAGFSANQQRGGIGGFGIDAAVASRLVLEAVLTYEADWKAVAAGKLKMPWDMEVGHRQTTPFYAARQTARFVREAVRTLGRRAVEAEPKVWLDAASSKLYPEYYLNDFHYQTDGWLSADSADVYETSTETLFLGRQDAMQRATLLPLAGKKPSKILEVACGTGRVGTFARDNHPDADYTGVDLSPFYLAKARDNDAYWCERTGGKAPATFVQANGEDLPFADGEYDAVICVYLFHELPADARANVAREMARVCKPGGTVVLTDSLQRGDRPALDARIDNFSKLNEPHYSNYVRDYLPALFTAHGLVPDAKCVMSTSKTLSFDKPPAEDEA